jgi:NADPH2:quinone reductase
MRAVIIREPKTQPVLGDHPEPVPGDGDSLVELRAGGLNPVDINIAAGRFPGGSPPTPYVAGVEGVGTVLRSARFAPGTRVYASGRGSGIARDGTFAERFVTHDEILVEVPDGVDDVTAAAFGVAGTAGWLPAAWRAPVRAGESVLVLGATGAVGAVTIQTVKVLGAGRVVAVGRNAARLERARSLGADETVELEGDEFAERLAVAVAQAPPTLILDGLWGAGIEAALPIAAPGARIVHLGQSASPHATLVSGHVRGKGLDILGYQNFLVPPDAFAEGYRALLGHVAAGRISLPIEAVPFDDVADAWKRVEDGSDTKLVLVP